MAQRSGETHAVARYLEVLRRHGVDTVGARPQLQFTHREIEGRDQFLKENNITHNRPVVGIHPGGNWRYKLWRPTNFSGLRIFCAIDGTPKSCCSLAPNEPSLQTQVADSAELEPIVVKTKVYDRLPP